MRDQENSTKEDVSLTAAQLRGLAERHAAFLHARLGSAKAEAEWRGNAAAVYAQILASRVGDVVDARVLGDALDAILTSEAVERAARPVAERVLALALREVRAEKGRAGDRVPLVTRRKIDALLERPGLLPDRLLREIVEQDSIEEVMRDVLFDGLKEFSEKVNPFTAEWGVPSLLKRAGPLGLGLGKGFDSVRAEFDKRLEPEIRKFLQSFSRRGLRKMAELVIEKGDEPRFVAVRKRLAAWVLEQQIAELARGVDDGAAALAQEIVLDVTASELGRSSLAMRRRAVIEEALAPFADRTVGEALREIGVSFEPDVAALAAATWPLVRSALATPAARAWIDAMVSEFYEAEIAALSVP